MFTRTSNLHGIHALNVAIAAPMTLIVLSASVFLIAVSVSNRAYWPILAGSTASMRRIRRIPKAAMFHIDIAHGDIPDSLLFANPNYIEDKKTLRQELNEFIKVGDCKEHEPYVSPRLWSLFDSYRILSARPLSILWYEGNVNARRWWEDGIIRDVLARNHIPEELRGFAPSNAIKTPHQHALNLIENEIGAEIRRMTIGESSKTGY